MPKNKLARAASARHQEKRINCAKKCPPTCKETGNWKSEESPTSQSRLCRGGAPLPIPKPLPEAEAAWGEKEALLPLLLCWFAGSHFSSCRNLLAEVSTVPFCRDGREFQYDRCQTAESYPALIKSLAWVWVQHFSLSSLRLTDSSLGCAEGHWLLAYGAVNSQTLWGWCKTFEERTNADFKS